MKPDRSFGCEFEFSTEWDEAVPYVTAVIPKRRLHVDRDYIHTENNRTWWHLKIDGSTDIELVTPISKPKDIPDICRVIMRLSSCLKVSENDGFHVHVSARDVDVRLLAIYWARCEKSIFSLVNNKRKSNDMCEAISESYKKGVKSLMEASVDHHAAMSCCYYEDRKTVEFRVAEGTRDWKFIEAWISFCLHFVEHCKKADAVSLITDRPFKVSVRQMLEDIKLPRKHVMTLLSRNKRINAPLAWEPAPPCKRDGQVRFLNGAPSRRHGQYGPCQSEPTNCPYGEIFQPVESPHGPYSPYHLQGL